MRQRQFRFKREDHVRLAVTKREQYPGIGFVTFRAGSLGTIVNLVEDGSPFAALGDYSIAFESGLTDDGSASKGVLFLHDNELMTAPTQAGGSETPSNGICQACKGTGRVTQTARVVDATCPRCKGDGFLSANPGMPWTIRNATRAGQCPQCHGTGRVKEHIPEMTITCWTCDGTGRGR